MKYDDKSKSTVLRFYIFSEIFPMLIEIADTHGEDDNIHEKWPEPDGARMYPHPIKSDSKSIEAEWNEKHPSSRISIKCYQWFRKSDMGFFYCEIICPSESKEDTEKSVYIYPFTKKEDTRENRRKSNESFKRTNKWYISKRERLKAEVLSQVVKKSSKHDYPEKSWLDMIRDAFMYEHRSCDEEKRQWTYPRQHSRIDRFERLLRRDILKSIQEWEDEKGVEVDHERK